MFKHLTTRAMIALIAVSITALISGCNICDSFVTYTPGAILKKGWDSSDPLNKGSEIKSMKGHFKSVMPEQKIYVSTDVYAVFPDKLCVVTVTPSIDTTIVVQNGKQAWQVSSIMGKRACIDSEFEQMMFDMYILDPSKKPDDIFESYGFVKNEFPELESTHWAITCTPRRDIFKYVFPKTFYVRKSDYMITRSKGKSIGDTEVSSATSMTESFKVYDTNLGIIENEKTYEVRDSSKLKSKTSSMEYNIDIPAEMFNEPDEI